MVPVACETRELRMADPDDVTSSENVPPAGMAALAPVNVTGPPECERWTSVADAVSEVPVAAPPAGVAVRTGTGGTVVAAAMQPHTNPTNAPGIQGGAVRPQLLSSGERAAFNAFSTLKQQGQTTTEFMGLTAQTAATVEFDATAAAAVSGWRLTFGGRAIPDLGDPASDGITTVDVAFGSTCGATAPVGTAQLTAVDQAFAFNLGNASQASGCVVLTMDGSVDQPLIDNVAVPEAGSLSMLVAGVLGLFGLASVPRA